MLEVGLFLVKDNDEASLLDWTVEEGESSQRYCQGPRLTMKAEERFLCVKREIRFLVW